MSSGLVVMLISGVVVASVVAGSRLYCRADAGRALARHRRPHTRRHMFAVGATPAELAAIAVETLDQHHARVVVAEPGRPGRLTRVSSVFRGQLLTLWFIPGADCTLVEVECTPSPRTALFGQDAARRFANGVVQVVAGVAAVPDRTPGSRPS